MGCVCGLSGSPGSVSVESLWCVRTESIGDFTKAAECGPAEPPSSPVVGECPGEIGRGQLWERVAGCVQ